MVDREFSETELREMLEQATGYRADQEAGRWVIESFRAGRAWEVIVEPQVGQQLLVVVTAYVVG